MSKLAKMKAALKAALTPEQVAAREAFKSKFEHGYYHGSPSNEIKVFDPSQSDKDLLATPQATFVTKEPAFAESFLPESAHEIVEGSGRYYPFSIGSTIYPVSINKGKHFDFGTPEGQALAKEFIKEKLIPEYGREKAARWLNSAQDELNNWKAMEHPDFLKHLQDTGHDSFAVTEGGIKNVGIFKPENIRGKFAEFDPAEAANPDFMKAEGGQVEGYAPGGKVGALSELIKMITNRGGTAAGKRLERAADLVPNLEQKYNPSALREAFTGDNASAAMIMKPSQFDQYANPLSPGHKASTDPWYRIGNPEQFASYKDMPEGSYQEYLNYLKQYVEPGGGGFNSVPYLQVGKDYVPTIKGHEGRHRSGVLEMMGDEPSLVMMQPRPELREQFPRRSQQEYLEALKNAEADRNGLIRVSPQKSEELGTRPMLDLPELFKNGGKV